MILNSPIDTRTDLPALLVRGTLPALAVGGLFFNGIAIFGAALILIALIADHWRHQQTAPSLDYPIMLIVAVFLLAAVATTPLMLSEPTLDPQRVIRNLGNLALIAIIPALLSLGWRPGRMTIMAFRGDFIGPFLVAIGLVITIFLLFQSGILDRLVWLPNEFNRVVMYICIFGWFAAAAAGAAGKPHRGAWLIAALTALAILSESATAAVSMILGSLAYFGCLHAGRGWLRVQTWAIVAFTAVTPLLSMTLPPTDANLEWLPFSWGERLAIWQSTAVKIAENPLTGWGLKSGVMYGWVIPESYQIFGGRLVLHPHNATLQVVADFGLTGLLAWTLLLYVMGKRIAGLHRNVRPYAAAAYVSAYMCAGLAVDLWTDSLLAILALTAALFRLLNVGSISSYDEVMALRAKGS